MSFQGCSGNKGALTAALLAAGCSAIAGEDTNIVRAARTDEDASWESVFTEENQVPFHINFYVKEGLYYEVMETSEYEGAFYTSIFSEKRRVTGRLGMKVHLDAALYQEKGALPAADNNFAFRRFRVNTFGRGFLLSPFTYGVEFGMADGKFFFNDGYVWFHEVPYVSSIKGGIFTAPMSMEALQSSSATAMMEVGSPITAFTPGDLLGLQLGGALKNKPVTLHGGWFADVNDSENRDASQSYARLIGRATWLPVDEVEENPDGKIIHLGASFSHMFTAGDGARYRSRPESYLAPFLIDTEPLGGDRAMVYGLEGAWQKGSVMVRGEFLQAHADDAADQTHRFGGAYLMASWVLTGERRAYNRDGGYFTKVTPARAFSFRDKSWGALEWTTRLSHSDLSDEQIQGGVMTILSTGFNVYTSKRGRIMFNAGVADVKNSPTPGEFYFLQTRFQIDL